MPQILNNPQAQKMDVNETGNGKQRRSADW